MCFSRYFLEAMRSSTPETIRSFPLQKYTELTELKHISSKMADPSITSKYMNSLPQLLLLQEKLEYFIQSDLKSLCIYLDICDI